MFLTLSEGKFFNHQNILSYEYKEIVCLFACLRTIQKHWKNIKKRKSFYFLQFDSNEILYEWFAYRIFCVHIHNTTWKNGYKSIIFHPQHTFLDRNRERVQALKLNLLAKNRENFLYIFFPYCRHNIVLYFMSVYLNISFCSILSMLSVNIDYIIYLLYNIKQEYGTEERRICSWKSYQNCEKGVKWMNIKGCNTNSITVRQKLLW